MTARLPACAIAGLFPLLAIGGVHGGAQRSGWSVRRVQLHSPAQARPAATIRLLIAVRARRRRPAPATRLIVALSRDRRRSRDDLRLGAALPLPVHGPRSRSLRVTRRLPASESPGIYRVLACIDARCVSSAALRVLSPPSSSRPATPAPDSPAATPGAATPGPAAQASPALLVDRLVDAPGADEAVAATRKLLADAGIPVRALGPDGPGAPSLSGLAVDTRQLPTLAFDGINRATAYRMTLGDLETTLAAAAGLAPSPAGSGLSHLLAEWVREAHAEPDDPASRAPLLLEALARRQQ